MLRSIFIAGALALITSSSSAAQQLEARPDRVVLIGPGGQTTIGPADVAAADRKSIRFSMHGVMHIFEGVALSELLAHVGAPSGHALRGDELTNVVIVTARDGYRVVLTLAETDPGMRRESVLLADAMDGAPLGPDDGPFRLVVEGDLRPARAARMVSRIEVRRLP